MKKVKQKISNLLLFSISSQAAFILFAEIILGIILILAATYFFADITKDTLFDLELLSFDDQVSQFIYSFRTPLITEIMIFISYLGADFILAGSTLIAIFLAWKKHKKEAILFSLMLSFGAALNLLLKEIFQRPRPTFDPIYTLSSYSFPSGHAMNSFVFYAVLAYFTLHFTKKVKLSLVITLLAGIIVLLIGLSRVYLGVHYPSDVLAGYAAGMMWFVFVLLTERTLVFFNLFKEFKKQDKKKI